MSTVYAPSTGDGFSAAERPARIPVPSPGNAVLACRCGQMLGLADMHRPVRPWPRASGHHAVIEPVCCRGCAESFR